ncbi:replication-relaxation family protein [Catenulispora rubra]|uniref:replication-relaxation family protein n=1 Tax=Catenulispora rubra TaxID=280293 RepID=UPI0018927244|nr:replication-relaxation family protein [Catenulispora rubra]
MSFRKAAKTRAQTARPASHAVADRITSRDARMLRLIAEHRVLTSGQITRALFTDNTRARKRIGALREAGLIETFRPPAAGSSQLHCVATAKALKLLGFPARSAVPAGVGQAAIAAALRQDLDHLRGVNEFFCRLLAHRHERGPGAALEEWRSEWSTARLFPGRVRPDGFGRWRDGDSWCEFFLEYDTGTEPLHRLRAKWLGYDSLMQAADTCSPVLFWLRSSGRERRLHELLAETSTGVPAATAVGDPQTADITGMVWRPTFTERRLTLAQLGRAACDHLGVPQRPNVL